MKTIQITGKELLCLRCLINGGVMQDGKTQTQIRGFIKEQSIPEGVKRIAHKNDAILASEHKSLEAVCAEIRRFKDDTLDAEELKAVIAQKENRLLDEAISVMIEEFDFAKVESCTGVVSNYQFLYEKLSK